jgi:S1-C subfamily serine protease
VELTSVEKGGPAERAGARAGDVLLKLGDVEVGGTDQLERLVSGWSVGKPMWLRLLRDGRFVEVSVIPAEAPGS